MRLAPTTLAKVSKLLPLLASDHDGEVVATARAVVRALRSAGHDLHDLVATLHRPNASGVFTPPDRATRKRKPRPDIDWSDQPVHAEVLRDGPRLLEWALDGMAEKFVIGMIEGAMATGPSFRMSKKQLAWFRRLVAEKLTAAELWVDR
jgi:hypothetical protein